jgi:hypothetical protein
LLFRYLTISFRYAAECRGSVVNDWTRFRINFGTISALGGPGSGMVNAFD